MKRIIKTKPSFLLLGLIVFASFDASSQAFRMVSRSDTTNQVGLVNNSDIKLTVLLSLQFDVSGNVARMNPHSSFPSDFVVPNDGVYHFDANLNFVFREGVDDLGLPVNSKLFFMRWYLKLVNGNKVIEQTVLTNPQSGSSNNFSLSLSTTVYLLKGDRISVRYLGEGRTGKVVYPTFISFSGFKVLDVTLPVPPEISPIPKVPSD